MMPDLLGTLGLAQTDSTHPHHGGQSATETGTEGALSIFDSLLAALAATTSASAAHATSDVSGGGKKGAETAPQSPGESEPVKPGGADAVPPGLSTVASIEGLQEPTLPVHDPQGDALAGRRVPPVVPGALSTVATDPAAGSMPAEPTTASTTGPAVTGSTGRPLVLAQPFAPYVGTGKAQPWRPVLTANLAGADAPDQDPATMAHRIASAASSTSTPSSERADAGYRAPVTAQGSSVAAEASSSGKSPGQENSVAPRRTTVPRPMHPQTPDGVGAAMESVGHAAEAPADSQTSAPASQASPAEQPEATAQPAPVVTESVSTAVAGAPAAEPSDLPHLVPAGASAMDGNLATHRALDHLASARAHDPTTATPDRIRAQALRAVLGRALSDGQDQTVQLQLEPENLGKVEVKLTVRGGRLEVQFTAETPAATQALREGATELSRTLGERMEARWQTIEVRVHENSGSGRTSRDPDHDESEDGQRDGYRDDQRRDQSQQRHGRQQQG